jgi:NAD-dependent deacetylase
VRFRDFKRIVFFTGAGLSSESGIPTYRGHGGLWKQYNYEDYACQRAFRRDPNKVWDFHDARRGLVAECAPNDGHRIIAELQAARGREVAVVTQNIDGLHVLALRAAADGGKQERGDDARTAKARSTTAEEAADVTAARTKADGRPPEIVELHGSLWRVRCDDERVVREDRSVPMAPRQCTCGAYYRPDIVWFEDTLDPRVIDRARALIEQCDLLVSVGTSAVVFPAADMPRIAMRRGATTVEVNLEDTPMSELYQHRLRGRASEMLALMSS